MKIRFVGLTCAAAGLLVAFGITLAACGSDGDSGPGTGPAEANLFGNASFEVGEEPWLSLDSEAWGKPFSVSQTQARSGTSSGLLELDSSEGETSVGARVYGIVQEISPGEFPEVLSGNYYVGRWEKGTPKQYLQFVVIVINASNIPPGVAPATNHQIRYVLAGADSPPIRIGNAQFVMVGTDEPEEGRWVSFERNIRQDFEELWGAVPEDFARLRILFEVRWDDRKLSDGLSIADVYYDDLYVGPAAD